MILDSWPSSAQVLRLTSLAAVVLLGACSAPRPHRAPVEDRIAPAVESQPAASASTEARTTAPSEGARPGSYVVKAGDTLLRIALEHGLSWRDLARWNALDNPNLIEVGQVLRVVPPQTAGAAGTSSEGLASRPIAAGVKVESKPLDSRVPEGKSSASQAAPTATAPVAASAVASQPAPTSAANGEGEIAWAWPSPGTLIAGFDEQRNKGIGIGGKAGDAVLAAADGRVMYAGSGLRGYGNMVIIKHNETYLSAYAHNQAVLVKEDQLVRKGQRIAEMGSSDADQVKLHFEIRRKGKPIDPAKLLPPR